MRRRMQKAGAPQQFGNRKSSLKTAMGFSGCFLPDFATLYHSLPAFSLPPACWRAFFTSRQG
jgi:hypothetical protein